MRYTVPWNSGTHNHFNETDNVKLISVLTRFSLIALILYGGYMVFAEQRIVRICETEVKSIEKSLEEKLDPNSRTVSFLSLNSDPLFFSWLFYAPANQAFAIQMVTKDSSELSTKTLVRIPSQPIGHYGIIDIQFNTEGNSPPLIKHFEVFGPNFLKTDCASDGNSQYKSPRLLDMLVRDKVDFFRVAQDRLSRRPLYYSPQSEHKSNLVELQHASSIALCYFTEEEDAGKALKHLEHAIRVIDDE